MKEGIYPDLSNEDYHKDTAVGSSGIKAFGQCPAIYEYEYLDPFKAKERASKYKSIGTHAHVALLEPELFKDRYVVSDEYAITYKGQKNENIVPMNEVNSDYKIFAEKIIAAGKTPILHSKYKQALAMTAAIKRHKEASDMLSGEGLNEASFFAKDEETGLMIKSRPDRLVRTSTHGVVLIDYKTTAIPLSTTKISNHAFGLGQHIQAAHHKRVTELATGAIINEVCYIVQMSEAPYLVRLFRLPQEGIQIGNDACRIHLDGIADCWKTGIFPDYPHTIEDLIVPNYLYNDFN